MREPSGMWMRLGFVGDSSTLTSTSCCVSGGFLDAFSHFYKRVCPSVGWSVPRLSKQGFLVGFCSIYGFVELKCYFRCIVGSRDHVVSENIENL